MTATTIRVQMAQRKDTAAGWTAANPILLLGEIGYETDTKKFKIGDGTTNWNSLAYLPIPDGSGNLIITGNLEIGSTGSLTFEGSTADGFETTLAVTNPTADRTITLPDVTGTVVTTGDTGTVTSTMLADGTIVDGDVNASAAIAGTKISPDFGSQTVQTTGIFSAAGGSAAAPSIAFTGDTNTGIYSPGADQVAVATNGTGRLFVDASGYIGIGNPTPGSVAITPGLVLGDGTDNKGLMLYGSSSSQQNIAFTDTAQTQRGLIQYDHNGDYMRFFTESSERLRITSAGLVGVGTSSPTNYGAGITAVSVNGSSGGVADFYFNGTRQGFIGTLGSNQMVIDTAGAAIPLSLKTNNNTALTIDASQRVGIGTSSPGGQLTVYSAGNQVRVESPAASNADILFRENGVTNWTAGYVPFISAFRFSNGSSDVLTLTNTGNVGIGTTSPQGLCDVAGSNGRLVLANGNTSGGMKITAANAAYSANGYLAFEGYSSEYGRFDSSGRLLVGTSSSPSVGYGQYARVVIQGYTGNANEDGALSLQRGEAAANIASGENIGRIAFNDNAGNSFADILCSADADAGANDYPGRLVFSVTADGASSPTEAMRIKNSRILNFANTPTYADNTAAKAGGLVDGDVYRKSDGTLMIVYT